MYDVRVGICVHVIVGMCNIIIVHVFAFLLGCACSYMRANSLLFFPLGLFLQRHSAMRARDCALSPTSMSRGRCVMFL